MQGSMTAEIAALQRMTVSELQERWFQVFGEPSRSQNKQYLFRRIAWELQARLYGGLSDRAKARIVELTPTSFIRARIPTTPPTLAQETPPPQERADRRPARDPRLPAPGTVITRAYKGQELRLVVHDDGFELDGVMYGSLSEAARAVTGAHWNGRLFWGLTKRKRRA